MRKRKDYNSPPDMRAIARQIDRDGEYAAKAAIGGLIECEHCHKFRAQVKNGLCSTCRKVLGLMHSPGY
jgi:hypothetical protein